MSEYHVTKRLKTAKRNQPDQRFIDGGFALEVRVVFGRSAGVSSASGFEVVPRPAGLPEGLAWLPLFPALEPAGSVLLAG